MGLAEGLCRLPYGQIIVSNMPIYAALLRGIMPTNPNMRNEKLRGVFESFDTTHPSTTKFMAEIDKKFNK